MRWFGGAVGAGAVAGILTIAALDPPPAVPEATWEIRPLPEGVRWVVIAGGAEPSSNQVSIAQDVAHVREVFGEGEGYVLFGGGRGAPVQVIDEPPASLRSRLGALFDPRDRAVSYRAGPEAWVDGPADYHLVLDTLESLDSPEVWLGGHGEGGQLPNETVLHLWGGYPLGVGDLADALDGDSRLFVTSCFGGGFADVLFSRGQPERGPAESVRCGLFATTFDAEASGCDPNPERAQQESYAIHLLEALQSEDPALDLDGDGRVSPREAHAHATVTARSLDVPTTSAERWLEHAVVSLPPNAPLGEAATPEEDHVVARLGAALGLPDEEAAQRRTAALRIALENDDAALAETERAADDAYYALRIRLLERWPVLDDPWHRDFDATLARDADAIAAMLDASEEGRAYALARDALDLALRDYDAARVELALHRRLSRAYDARVFARAVAAAGGEAWTRYQALVDCERRPLP